MRVADSAAKCLKGLPAILNVTPPTSTQQFLSIFAKTKMNCWHSYKKQPREISSLVVKTHFKHVPVTHEMFK